MAVWSEFFQGGPIFWRKRDHHITDGKWSLIRASVFFITRIDGNIELWDILTRTDAPSIAHNLGGHIITVISQHKLPLATDVLVVGDHKGNVRVFTPPAEFLRAVTEEVTVNLIENGSILKISNFKMLFFVATEEVHRT